MDVFENEARQREAEYNLYFRIVSEGLTTRTAQEVREELDAIAMYTTSPALREKCKTEMARFSDVVVPLAANGR